jgi:hypothetical protein
VVKWYRWLRNSHGPVGWVIVHLPTGDKYVTGVQYFGTNINVQSQIPSWRNEFGVVTKFLFQLGICALFVPATRVGVGVVVIPIVIVAIASVVKFGVCVVSKVVRSAGVLFSVILVGGG